jgi:hypothetical protein
VAGRVTAGARLASIAALAIAVACGGKGKSETAGPRDGGDAAEASAEPARTTPDGAAAPYLVAAADADGGLVDAGSVAVTVTWSDPPAALLRSPGLSPCGSKLPPPVSVHTLHGLRDAVVRLEGVREGVPPRPAAAVEIAVRDCQLEPRVQVAPRLGVPLAVINDDGERREVALAQLGAGEPEPLARLPMPLVGQRYELPLDRPGLVRARMGDRDSYVFAPPHPYAAVTSDKGRVEFEQVPPGTYTVVAWHPPVVAGGAPLEARGEVTVVAGETAELELEPRPE